MRASFGLARGLICAIALVLLPTLGRADTDDLDRQRLALDMITDTAAELCESPAPEHAGQTRSIKLSGAAQVELSKLIRKFVDLGIEGAAEYESREWQGVLQKDLAPLLEKGLDCRLEVLRILQDKLLPPRVDSRAAPREDDMLYALSNYRYEFGWSMAPRGTVDKRFALAPITDVRARSGNRVVLTYARPQGEGTLHLTFEDRSLIGQWQDYEGEGEIALVFDKSLSRATGWWNSGGHTQQYNAFMRRVD